MNEQTDAARGGPPEALQGEVRHHERRRPFDKLKVSFRPLVQYRTAFVEDDEAGGDGNTFVRTRLRLEYPVTKKLAQKASWTAK